MAALTHAVNTWLCYRLAFRLTDRKAIAALAAFFFGVHWTLFDVTYGLASLPDLLCALFSVLAMLGFQRYLETQSVVWKGSSWLACAAALLSSETAVILPLLLALLSWVHSRQAEPHLSRRRRLAGTLEHSALHWGLLAVYLVHLAVLGMGLAGGSVRPQPGNTAEASGSFRQKIDLLWWLGNLPPFYDRSNGPSEVMRREAEQLSPRNSERMSQRLFVLEGIARWVGTLSWLPVLIWAGFRTVRRPEIRPFLPLCLGLVLSAGIALLVEQKAAAPNLYLATCGLAIWLALCLHAAEPKPGRRAGIRAWTVAAYLLREPVPGRAAETAALDSLSGSKRRCPLPSEPKRPKLDPAGSGDAYLRCHRRLFAAVGSDLGRPSGRL
jgi:hypothetical protein